MMEGLKDDEAKGLEYEDWSLTHPTVVQGAAVQGFLTNFAAPVMECKASFDPTQPIPILLSKSHVGTRPHRGVGIRVEYTSIKTS